MLTRQGTLAMEPRGVRGWCSMAWRTQRQLSPIRPFDQGPESTELAGFRPSYRAVVKYLTAWGT